jgi:hypothetical protein
LWGHGGFRPRVVRIGTHKDGNFRSRIIEHYLLDESKMNFDSSKAAPRERSIFRKHIGRALLNKRQDDYLKVWEIDFTSIFLFLLLHSVYRIYPFQKFHLP